MNRRKTVISLPWIEMDQTKSEWMTIKQCDVVRWKAFEGFPWLMSVHFSCNLTTSSTFSRNKIRSQFVHLTLQGLEDCHKGFTNRKIK